MLFCIFSLPSIAENIRFKKIDITDGLPFNSVRAITGGNLGHVWFGTELGLARYDGYALKSYFSNTDQTNTIGDSYIVTLKIDNSGVLWIGGAGGLSRYNQITDDFTVFVHNEVNSLSSNQINAIEHGGNNNLWIATDKGLDFFDTSNYHFSHFSHEPSNQFSLPSKDIRTLLLSSEGKLYVGSDKGLSLFDSKNKSFKLINLQDGKQPIIRSLSENKSGEIWIGTHNGLFKYNPKLFTIEKILFQQDVNFILSALVDYNDDLWIGTFQHGLFRLGRDNKIINVKPDKSDANSLSDATIMSLHQDQSGMIWVGTRNSGVNSFHPDSILLGAYNNSTNSFLCLPSDDIRSALALRKDKALIGTLSGLSEVDLKHKTCANYKAISGNIHSLSHNEVYSIHKDSLGAIWIGTANGLDKFNPINGMFEQFGNQINNENVYYITNNNDFLIIATNKNLYKLNISTKKISKINKNETTSNFILQKGKDGVIWVATERGLFFIDNQLDYVHQVNYKDSTFNNKEISGLVVDQNGVIWITIENEGLFIFHPETSTLVESGKQIGLKLKTGVAGLYKDMSNNLWLATLNKGLFKINNSREQLTNYHVPDGLHSESFNFASFTEFPDGKLLFGGKSGFNLFDSEKIRVNKTVPIVSLTELRRFGEIIKPKQSYDGFVINEHISSLKLLELSYRDSVFGFDFIGIHHIAPDKIKYAYKLEGFDQDWIYTSSQNRGVTYNNVDAGNYTFHLKARTDSGNWSKENVALNIQISPAPWLTWWAFSIYLTTFILSVYLFIRKRTQILEHRAQILESTVTEKTNELVIEKQKVEQLLARKNEEFANVSHEFRTPLTLILGPISQVLSVLKNRRNKHEINRLEVAQRNGYRLLRMVDQLLNLETFKVRSITQKAPQATGKIIQLIAEAFADLAKEANIKLNIGHIEELNFEFTLDALEKIVVNLLSNSIKYTKPHGQIDISTYRTSNNELQIIVADTGIGIPEDKLDTIFDRYNRVLDENSEQVTGAGIGLSLVKSLVEFHEGRIEIESGLGVGTKIIIYLPIVGEVENASLSRHENNEVLAMELMSLTQQKTTINEAKEPHIEHSDSSKPLILVIEDNEDMRQYIVDSISSDYQTITANDGEQGVLLAIEQVPDLIISDVMMPKMDGFEATQKLRDNAITNHIPIILLTARGDRESRLKGWKEKADEYITKPFDVEELKIRLINLLEIRNILKKRFGESAFLPNQEVTERDSSDTDNKMNQRQLHFVKQLNKVIEALYIESNTGVADIASAIAMSERQLFRKLKSVLDMTPAEYLRRFRLEKAQKLLSEGHNASYTTFEVGFSSQSYFGKCFKAQFGISPSEFMKKTS